MECWPASRGIKTVLARLLSEEALATSVTLACFRENYTTSSPKNGISGENLELLFLQKAHVRCVLNIPTCVFTHSSRERGQC